MSLVLDCSDNKLVVNTRFQFVVVGDMTIISAYFVDIPMVA